MSKAIKHRITVDIVTDEVHPSTSELVSAVGDALLSRVQNCGLFNQEDIDVEEVVVGCNGINVLVYQDPEIYEKALAGTTRVEDQ